MAVHAAVRLSGLCLAASVVAGGGIKIQGTKLVQVGDDCRHSKDPALEQSPDPGLQHIHVAYASHFGWASTGLLTSMVSLARHLKDPGQCTIHVVLAQEHMQEAADLLMHYRQELWAQRAVPDVELHELSQPHFNISTFSTKSESGEPFRSRLLTPQTFARLRLTDYLPNVSRVLWLDHDTVVVGDVTPLYRMKMRHAMAAAQEWCGLLCPIGYYARPSGKEELKRRGEYFDANWPGFDTGIVLMDLDRWRSEKLPERLEDWVKVTNGFEGDQGALNIVFRGLLGIDLLDWRWNLQPHAFHQLSKSKWPDVCVAEAHILHFSGAYKPWASCWASNLSAAVQQSEISCRDGLNWRIDEVFNRYAVWHNPLAAAW